MFNIQIFTIMGLGAIFTLVSSILAVLGGAGKFTSNKLQARSNRENVNAFSESDDTASGIGTASDAINLLSSAFGGASGIAGAVGSAGNSVGSGLSSLASENVLPNANTLFNQSAKSLFIQNANKIPSLYRPSSFLKF